MVIKVFFCYSIKTITMKLLISLTIFILIMLPFRVNAGWVITGRYIDREGNTIMKRYFIQNNEIKVEQFNLIYSINLKTESIIIVDPVNLVFVKTNLKAYATKLNDIKLSRLNGLLALIPEDQKSEYEKKYKDQANSEVFLPVYKGDSLTIKPLADTTKLLGHRTAKFILYENGRKKEEFFFTNEINMSSDLNMNTFLTYVYLLEPEDKTVRYRVSDKYIEMVKSGLVLRRFIFEDGYRTEWQVNNIEEKNIPSYEFGVPDLCKELSLDKWLSRKKEVEEKFYDDYE